MPHTPSATMPCRASNDGSDGAAGRSAVRSSTKATASPGSRCGRLPIPVTVPSPKSGSRAITSVRALWKVGVDSHFRSPVSPPREWLPTVPVGKSQPVASEGRPAAGAGGEPGPWAFRIAWIVLPFTTGPLLSDALSSTDDAFRITATVALWAIWALTLAAALVERTLTLTIVRVAAPAAVAAAAWATAATSSIEAWKAALAFASTLLAAAAALSPLTGDAFVNGSAYGPERRMALRPTVPALLLAPLAWAIGVAGLAAGPLLLAAGELGPGLAALVVGGGLGVLALRALHGLSRRWIVFVPAGLVIHDPLTMSDAVLFPRRSIVRLGPAEPADAASDRVLDVTGGAPGLALHVEVDVPQSIGVRDGRRRTTNVEVADILVTPTRPGEVLAEAAPEAHHRKRPLSVSASHAGPPPTTSSPS